MTSLRTRMLLAGALTALAVLSPRSATAQVVWSQLPDNANGYYNAPPYWIADDFTLGTGTTVSSFTWFGLRNGTGGPSTVSADYSWQIFSDAAGAPGSSLGGGSVVGGLGTKTSYDTNTSLALAAGTYWLSVGNYVEPTAGGYFWATSGNYVGNGYQSADGVNYYSMGSVGFAFEVTASAVPEPASMTLLATGLVGVFAAARRRRKA